MERSLRINEYNTITNDIKYIDSIIKKAEDTINRMKNQVQTNFTMSQIIKISDKNIERKKLRDSLTDRLRLLNEGLLDDELKANMKQKMNEAKAKAILKENRKKTLAADKAEKNKVSKAYYQAHRNEARQNRYLKKNMSRSYKHFSRACNSIPDYMIRNLSEMPNNKGYFWKSVACYGDLPAEPGKPTVLFDRRRGGIMIIHEWTTDEYKVYEKQGKENKVLVSTQKRKKRQLPPTCAAEIEKRKKEEAERKKNKPKKFSDKKSSKRYQKRSKKEKDARKKRSKKEKDPRKKRSQNSQKYGRGTGSKWDKKC
jgi:hypothetical protein